MKKLQTLLIQLFLGILLTSASCKKNNEEPKHKNIVTATINGNPWKAGCKESPPFGCNIGDFQYYPNTGGFELAASNIEKDSSIAIFLNSVHISGSYRILNKIACATFDKGDLCGWQRHYINESDPQEIEIINIDNENKIIEGRFNFIGRDTLCGSEPVHITNGYFKMKYRP